MEVIENTPGRLVIVYRHLFSTAVVVLTAAASLTGATLLFWDEPDFLAIGLGWLAIGTAMTVLLARFMMRRERWEFDRAADTARHIWQSHTARREAVLPLSRISGASVTLRARDGKTVEPHYMLRLDLADGTTQDMIAHPHVGPMPAEIARTVNLWLKQRRV